MALTIALGLAAVSQPTVAQRVRLHIYERFLETAQPPVVEELMTEFSLPRAKVGTILDELVDTRAIAVVKGTSRILMAWPFSAITTPFVVRANDRTYFANCSWDSIAFHAMLGNAPVSIESYCHHCARPIRIDFDAGEQTRVDPESAIVYLALRPSQWWEDIILSCSNTMVFFCSAQHRDASGLGTGTDQAASLTPQETHDLGVPLYERRLEIDFVRPGRDELNAHFARLGLGADYWRV
jgi:hypothetical protein